MAQRTIVILGLALAGALSLSSSLFGADQDEPARLAFIRGSENHGVLMTAAENGTATEALTSTRDGSVLGYSWSPDGGRIALTQCPRWKLCHAYLIDALGEHRRLIARDVWSAIWMLDGRHVVIEPRHRKGYRVLNVETGSRRRFNAPGLASAPGAPRVSPNGRWLLHLAPPYGQPVPTPGPERHHLHAKNWLVITNLLTGRSRKLSKIRGWYVLGAAPWSPDGSAITFTRRKTLQTSGGSLFVTGVNGVGGRRLARGVRGAGSWSADRKRVVFNDSLCHIRIVSIEDASSVTLSFIGCMPSFQPS
jgi:Tol biopolymer transport system component